MAASALLIKEGLITANTRFKLYQITHDGSDAGLAIIPGLSFTHPVGSYDCVSASSGTYTFVFTAGTSTYLSNILFFSGR